MLGSIGIISSLGYVNTIADNQYGFRRGHPMLDTLSRLKTIVREATTGNVRQHMLVGVLNLDVKNAFDFAPREAIVRVAGGGVLTGLYRMLKAYLSGRSL